jgi:hypothetical protein
MDIPESILKRCKSKKNKDDAPNQLRIDRILPDDPMCEDCGKLCSMGRTVEYARVNVPVDHWRRQCKKCNLYYNPLTLKYDIDHSHKYPTAFREYLHYRDK